MLKQETVSIMNKSCCDNVNAFKCFLSGCVPEKRDFTLVSLSIELVTSGAVPLEPPLLHPVLYCHCQYFVAN